MRVFILGILWAGLAGSIGRGQEAHFASGPHRVAVIELYTSEGCSSCPPADRWLGALRTDEGLWRDYVPVAFHVNYWDSLGWRDRLASAEATDRQYRLASAWGSRSVYTPCFVRDGAEWHPEMAAPGRDAGTAGTLTAEVTGGICRIHWQPGAAAGVRAYSAHVVLLGGGLSSRVTAGENRGATLEHEFVALGMAEAPLAPSEGGPLAAVLALPRPAVPDARRRALAIWVAAAGALAPLQATGGWLP
jgi:hypothetical protein